MGLGALSPDGIIQRHFAIPHGGGGEYQPIAVDTSKNVYFCGGMDEHWWIEPISTAIVPWTDGGGWDACVVKFETSVEVNIDIKPGSFPNAININSHGVIPVAILGSDIFDVSDIDPVTLSFGGLSVRTKNNDTIQCSIEDVSGNFSRPKGLPDGYPDLVCQFVDEGGFLAEDDGTAKVEGFLYDGTPIMGVDSIKLVNK